MAITVLAQNGLLAGLQVRNQEPGLPRRGAATCPACKAAGALRFIETGSLHGSGSRLNPVCVNGCPKPAVLDAVRANPRCPVDRKAGELAWFNDGQDVVYRWLNADGSPGPANTRHANPSAHRDRKCSMPAGQSVRGLWYTSKPFAAMVDDTGPVFIVEGEHDVEAAHLFGLNAASYGSQSQAGSADIDVLTPLAGRITVVIDKDQAGDQGAARLAARLAEAGLSADWVHAKTGKDLADHLTVHHSPEGLVTVPAPVAPTATVQRSDASRLRARCLANVAPKLTRWLWAPGGQPWLPAGQVSLLTGEEGVGKSTFAAWLAAKVTTGTLEGDFKGAGASVLIVSTEEDAEHDWAPRLAAAGADLSRCHFLDVVQPYQGQDVVCGSFRLPDDAGQLEAYVAELQPSLLVLDPLSESIQSKGSGWPTTDDIRRAAVPLKVLGTNTGLTTVGIGHFNKGRGGNIRDKTQGSSGYRQFARTQLALVHYPPSGGLVLGIAKTNKTASGLTGLSLRLDTKPVQIDGESQQVAVMNVLGPSGVSVHDAYDYDPDSPQAKTLRSQADIAADQIKAYLAEKGGQAPSAEVITHIVGLGHSESMDKRAWNQLRKRGEVDVAKPGGVPHRVLLTPPPTSSITESELF